jgi:hypothetical protein
MVNATRAGVAVVLLAISGCGSSEHDLGGTSGKAGSAGNAGGSGGSGGSSGSDGTGKAGSAGNAGSAGAGAQPSECADASPTETSCSGGVDEDCDGQIDCADTDCNGMDCGAPGYTCSLGGCVTTGVLPELPTLTNVETTVNGSSVEIAFDPIDGARDYRVYAFPDVADVTVDADGRITVRNATYRYAGNRMVTDAGWNDDGQAPQGAGVRTSVENVDIGGYVRTLPEATLGYVWRTPGDGRAPVYAISDPGGADYYPDNACYGMVWYESRTKRYVVSEDERSMLVSQGWRDDGVAFYVPSTASAMTTVIYSGNTFDYENNLIYYPEGPESDVHDDKTPAFDVLTSPSEGTLPLMRVFYSVCGGKGHDELVAGQARFERAYRQGSKQPHFGLHWSGLSGTTTLVIEALDQLGPWRGAFIGPATNASASSGAAPWVTVDDARAASSTGEVHVNGQGDAGNLPRAIARSFVTVSPEDPPPLDWARGWTADDDFGSFEGEECLANAAADCGASDWSRSSSSVVQFNSVEAPWYGMRAQLGELWVGIRDLGAGTKFRLFPATQGNMTADSFLYATMLVDSFTTGRRYPQIIIADADIPYPVAQNMNTGNALIVQSFGDWPSRLQLEVCDHVQWEVNNQCPAYPDGRLILDAQNPDPSQPVRVAPVRDFYERTAGVDQSVLFEVYASTERVYIFLDSEPYACMDLPAAGVPSGPVNLAFGDVLYHSGAEVQHSEFLFTTDNGLSMRHFANLGFRNGVDAPSWDEARLPCQPASWLGLGR